jgi:hypothetical protein
LCEPRSYMGEGIIARVVGQHGVAVWSMARPRPQNGWKVMHRSEG